MCVADPDNVLIYASADLGEVRFKDPEETRTDSYVVGRSMRPVAVAYLPDTQVVHHSFLNYWPSINENKIKHHLRACLFNPHAAG